MSYSELHHSGVAGMKWHENVMATAPAYRRRLGLDAPDKKLKGSGGIVNSVRRYKTSKMTEEELRAGIARKKLEEEYNNAYGIKPKKNKQTVEVKKVQETADAKNSHVSTKHVAKLTDAELNAALDRQRKEAEYLRNLKYGVDKQSTQQKQQVAQVQQQKKDTNKSQKNSVAKVAVKTIVHLPFTAAKFIVMSSLNVLKDFAVMPWVTAKKSLISDNIRDSVYSNRNARKEAEADAKALRQAYNKAANTNRTALLTKEAA